MTFHQTKFVSKAIGCCAAAFALLSAPRTEATTITYIADNATSLEFIASGNLQNGEVAHQAIGALSPSGFWGGVYSVHHGSESGQIAYWQIGHYASGGPDPSGAMTFGAIVDAGDTDPIFQDADFDDLLGVEWAGEFTVGAGDHWSEWTYHLRIGPPTSVPDAGAGMLGIATLMGVCLAARRKR